MTTALTDRSLRAKIIGVREQRRLAEPLKYSNDINTGNVILEGYASTFSPYEVGGGPSAGGWIEQMDLRAFDRTLGENPDVMLLINHTDMPLARTKSGTLSLQTDRYGLRVRAMLDSSDPDVQRLMPKMRRGDMDEMSFAFRVRDQRWDSNYTERMITDVNLDTGDVSIVNFGMNRATSAMLSSADAIDALAKLSNTEIFELRNSMDPDRMRRAMTVLQRAAATPKTAKGAPEYADPGYKDGDGNPAKGGNGVKRFRLNSAPRVRSTSRYISMPKYRRGYTAEQLSAIEGRIQSAAERFNVKLSESKSGSVLRDVDHIVAEANAAGGTVLVAVLTNGERVTLPDSRAASAASDCKEGDDMMESSGGDDDSDDERALPADCDTEMDDDEGAAARGAADEYDDDEGMDVASMSSGGERKLDLGKVISLEHTIHTCYDMAREDLDMRAMLARARRQVRDLQGIPAQQIDVADKLEELRSEFGDPETISVSDGLRAISQLGFTDTVRPNARGGAAAALADA